MPIGDIEEALKAQQIANINYNKFKANKAFVKQPVIEDNSTKPINNNPTNSSTSLNLDNVNIGEFKGFNTNKLAIDTNINSTYDKNLSEYKKRLKPFEDKLNEDKKKIDKDYAKYRELFNRNNNIADETQRSIQDIANEVSPIYKKFKNDKLYNLDKDIWTNLAAKYQSVLETTGEKNAALVLNSELEHIVAKKQTSLENLANGLDQFGSTFTGSTVEMLGMLYGLGKAVTGHINKLEGAGLGTRVIDTVLDNEVTKFSNDLMQYGVDVSDIGNSFSKAKEQGLPNFYNAKPVDYGTDVKGTLRNIVVHPSIQLSDLFGQSGFTASAIVGGGLISSGIKFAGKGVARVTTRELRQYLKKQGLEDATKLQTLAKLNSKLKTNIKYTNIAQRYVAPVLLAINEAGIEGLYTKRNIIDKGTQRIDELRAEQVKDAVNKTIENNYKKVIMPTPEGGGEVVLVDKKTGKRHSLIEVYKNTYEQMNQKYYNDMEQQLNYAASKAGMQNFFMNTAMLTITNSTLKRGLLSPSTQKVLSEARLTRGILQLIDRIAKSNIKLNIIRNSDGTISVTRVKPSKLSTAWGYIKEPLGQFTEEALQNITDNAAEAAAMNNLEEFIHRKYNGETSVAVGQDFGTEWEAFKKGAGKALTSEDTYVQGLYGALSSIMGTPFLARRGRNKAGEKVWFRDAVDADGNKESWWSIAKRITPWRSGLSGTRAELNNKIKLAAAKDKALEEWLNTNPNNEKKLLGAIGLSSWDVAMGKAASKGDEFAYRNSRLGKTVQMALYLDQLKGTDFYDSYMNIYQKAANMQNGDDDAKSVVAMVRAENAEGTKDMTDDEIVNNVRDNATRIIETINNVQKESSEIDKLVGYIDDDTKQSLIYGRLSSFDTNNRIKSLSDELAALHIQDARKTTSSLSKESQQLIVLYGGTKGAEKELNNIDSQISMQEKLLERTKEAEDVDKHVKKKIITKYKDSIKELKVQRDKLASDIESTREELKNNPLLSETEIMALDNKYRAIMLRRGKARLYAARHGDKEKLDSRKQQLNDEIQKLEEQKASYIDEGGRVKKGHNKQVDNINKEIAKRQDELTNGDPSVKNFYSKEQQAVLDSLLMQAEQQDKESFDKIIDIGRLQQRLEDYYNDMNDILENPDGFSYRAGYVKYLNSKFLAKNRAKAISNISSFEDYASAVDDVLKNGTAVEKEVIPRELDRIAAEREDDENSNYGRYKKSYKFINDFFERLDNGTFLDGGTNWQRNILAWALQYLRDKHIDFTNKEDVRNALLEKEGSNENSIFKFQNYLESREDGLKEVDKTPFSSESNDMLDLIATYESALDKYLNEKSKYEEVAKAKEIKEKPSETSLVEPQPKNTSHVEKPEEASKEKPVAPLKSKSKLLHNIVNSIIETAEPNFLNNLIRGLNTLNVKLDIKAIQIIQNIIDSGNISENSFIDALKKSIAEKTGTKIADALNRVLKEVSNESLKADIRLANKTDSIDIAYLSKNYPDHPIVKFYESMGVYKAIKSNKLTSSTKVYFIHSSDLTQAVKDYLGDAFTFDDTPVIIAVESESGSIEINDKKYQAIGVMPATNSNSSGSNNLGFIRNRINISAEGYNLITDNGKPIETTLYGKPTAEAVDNNYRGRNDVFDVIINTPALSAEDKAEIDKNNHSFRYNNLKNKRWRELAVNFIHSLRRVNKDGRNTLVYAQNRLNGTYGESYIWIKDIGDSTNAKGDTILDIINRGTENSKIAKEISNFNDTFNYYFYRVKEALKKVATQEELDDNYLKIISKDIENTLNNAFNISDSNNSKYNVVLNVEDDNINVKLYNTKFDESSNSYVTEQIPIVSFNKDYIVEESAGNIVAYGIFKNLFLDGEGEIRKTNNGFPVLKYQVNYNLIDNLDNEEKKEAIENYYMQKINDGILQISATQLDHSFRFVSINSPSIKNKPKPKAVIVNNDNADSAKPEKETPKPKNTKHEKSKITEAQRKSLEVLDKAIEQGKRLKLSDNDKDYKDKDSNTPYLRVTTAKYGIDGVKRFDPNNPNATVSHHIGNSADAFMRDLFDDYDTEEPYIGNKNSLKDKNYKESYQGITEQSLRTVEIEIRKKIIDRCKKDGWIFYSKGITCKGTITMLDSNNIEQHVKVAGTIDLIAIDKYGNFHLFDFKTTHEYKNLVDEGYKIQMYLYKMLLANMGINIVDANLIALKTNYPNPTSKKGYTEKDGILYYDGKPYEDNIQTNIPLLIKVPLNDNLPPFRLNNFNEEERAIIESQINIYEGDNPEINIEAEIMEEETPESIIDYDEGSDYVSADSTENLGIDDLESTPELKDKVNQKEWDNMSDIEKQRNSDCSKIRK